MLSESPRVAFCLSFTVPGQPTPWARARANAGRFFKAEGQEWAGAKVSDAFVRARQALYDQDFGFAKRGLGPWLGPIRLTIEIVLPRPTKWRGLPSVKPDWDNYGKLISDALNGYAYRDDGQIVEATVRKVYGEPAAHVWLEMLDEPVKPKRGKA